MVEPEIAFATPKENAELAEGLLKHALETVLEARGDDMALAASTRAPAVP